MAFEDLIKDGIVTIEGDKENLTALEKITRINWLLRKYKEEFEKMSSVIILPLTVGENNISYSDIYNKYVNKKSTIVVQRVNASGEPIAQTPIFYPVRFTTQGYIQLYAIAVTDEQVVFYYGSLEQTTNNKINFSYDTGYTLNYSELSEIISDFPEIKGDIEALYETVSELNTSVTGLIERMNTAEENIDDINDTITVITPIVNRALLTPISTPTEKLLTGVDETNAQMMVKLGNGLSFSGTTSPFTLSATSDENNVVIYEGYLDFNDNAIRMSPTTAQDIVDTVNSGKTVILMAEGAEITGHTTTYAFVVDYVDDADSSSGYSFTTLVSNGLKVEASGVAHDSAIFNIYNVNYEETSNKVTSISSASTDTQYPSAKAVYNAIQGGGQKLYHHRIKASFTSDGSKHYFTIDLINSTSTSYTTTGQIVSQFTVNKVITIGTIGGYSSTNKYLYTYEVQKLSSSSISAMVTKIKLSDLTYSSNYITLDSDITDYVEEIV